MSDIGPGTLVECVDDRTYRRPERCPTRGVIYTVRGIHPDGDAITLMEIVNRPRWYSNGIGEVHFYIRRFRPVRDDSIQIFRDIAKNAPVDGDKVDA